MHGKRTAGAWQLTRASWSTSAAEVVASDCTGDLALVDGTERPREFGTSITRCPTADAPAADTERKRAPAQALTTSPRRQAHCLDLLTAPWAAYVDSQPASADLARLTEREQTFFWRRDTPTSTAECQSWTLQPARESPHWGTLSSRSVEDERQVLQVLNYAIVRNALHVYGGSWSSTEGTQATIERSSQWRVFYFDLGEDPFTQGLWYRTASACARP